MLADYTVSADRHPGGRSVLDAAGRRLVRPGERLVAGRHRRIDGDRRGQRRTEAACLLHQASSTVYGPDGTVTSTTDAVGKTTSYQYNLLGERTKTTDANGQITTYGYDLEGNQTSESDPNGNTTASAFDLDGNQTRQTVTNSGGAAEHAKLAIRSGRRHHHLYRRRRADDGLQL